MPKPLIVQDPLILELPVIEHLIVTPDGYTLIIEKTREDDVQCASLLERLHEQRAF